MGKRDTDMTPIQQLDSRYLLYGLNALSRAFASNYFEDGHRGGAMVSAYYLCKEAGVEDTVAPLLGAAIDERWATTDLCAAFPDEPAQPELVEKILDGRVGRPNRRLTELAPPP